MGRKALDPMIRLQAGLKEASNGCLEWQRGRNKNGYGVLSVNGKPAYTHRLAYEAAHGPVPEGEVVRHSCDNPPCCNPNHLLIGTQAENVADRVARGRTSRVARLRKLSDEQIRSIRTYRAEGVSVPSLAKAFGVSLSAIYHLEQGRTWKNHK